MYISELLRTNENFIIERLKYKVICYLSFPCGKDQNYLKISLSQLYDD